VNKLDSLIKSALAKPKKVVAVACPENVEVLDAITLAVQLNLGDFLLFGNESIILNLLKDNPHLNIGNSKIINAETAEEACKLAVQAVSSKQADVLMKGLIDTAIILKQVLNKEYGLRTNQILSHVMVLDLPKFDRFIYLTDGAMIIDPSSLEMKQIVINAVTLATKLENKKPKVALISAIEKVNPKMPSTVKEDEVYQMYVNGEITDCDLIGPVAVDIALDKEAAKTKNIKSEVGGNADILVVPYIEVGNALYKGWVYGTDNVIGAGIIMGAKAPIVLTSRSDSHQSKLYSLALAMLIA
jgi:phosphate butyryltransferase